MNKSNIFEVVSKGVADILYTKKDGTERVIKATLLESVVPTVEQPKTLPDTHINIFDVEKTQWRTLIIDQIKSVSA